MKYWCSDGSVRKLRELWSNGPELKFQLCTVRRFTCYIKFIWFSAKKSIKKVQKIVTYVIFSFLNFTCAVIRRDILNCVVIRWTTWFVKLRSLESIFYSWTLVNNFNKNYASTYIFLYKFFIKIYWQTPGREKIIK